MNGRTSRGVLAALLFAELSASWILAQNPEGESGTNTTPRRRIRRTYTESVQWHDPSSAATTEMPAKPGAAPPTEAAPDRLSADRLSGSTSFVPQMPPRNPASTNSTEKPLWIMAPIETILGTGSAGSTNQSEVAVGWGWLAAEIVARAEEERARTATRKEQERDAELRPETVFLFEQGDDMRSLIVTGTAGRVVAQQPSRTEPESRYGMIFRETSPLSAPIDLFSQTGRNSDRNPDSRLPNEGPRLDSPRANIRTTLEEADNRPAFLPAAGVRPDSQPSPSFIPDWASSKDRPMEMPAGSPRDIAPNRPSPGGASSGDYGRIGTIFGASPDGRRPDAPLFPAPSAPAVFSPAPIPGAFRSLESERIQPFRPDSFLPAATQRESAPTDLNRNRDSGLPAPTPWNNNPFMPKGF
ncbi:MAG: hypothetical protein U1E27_01335 [Kiritimatiellia bacterium]|nr:hypothetical protein [Kiritimatiellia bacterium]